MTQYWASPTGGGSGTGPGSPFLINSFWSVAVPGDILNLNDGTYTGTNSMIRPPAGISGTLANPITIRAVNDGSVFINGQGTQNRCIWLDYAKNNHYFTVEGINAANGLNYVIDASSTGHIFRRCIAWNAIESDEGEQAWRANGYNGLIEDCAAFGGRYAMGGNQMGIDAPVNPMKTFRRCFSVFTGSTSSSPKASFLYWYSSDPMRCENCIATWDNNSVSNGQGIIYAASADPYVHGSTNTEVLGCIAYLKTTQNGVAFMSGISAHQNRRITFNNCIAYMAPGHPASGVFPLDLRAHNTSQCPNHAGGSHGTLSMNISNTTGIGSNASTITSDWTQTNVKTGTSLASVYGAESLWVNNGSKGATICKRYQDGVLGTTGLWPWPMNARILSAMAAAGLTPINVTADMEAIFGTIPAACLSETVPEIPPSQVTTVGDSTYVYF